MRWKNGGEGCGTGWFGAFQMASKLCTSKNPCKIYDICIKLPTFLYSSRKASRCRWTFTCKHKISFVSPRTANQKGGIRLHSPTIIFGEHEVTLEVAKWSPPTGNVAHGILTIALASKWHLHSNSEGSWHNDGDSQPLFRDEAFFVRLHFFCDRYIWSLAFFGWHWQISPCSLVVFLLTLNWSLK